MRKSRFIIFWSLMWLAAQGHAHMLNMTEMKLAISEDSDAELEVRVDLGQSGLLTPQEYWAAVSAPGEEDRRQRLQPALEQLADGITVVIDGVAVKPVLGSYSVEAVSLPAIQNPLTPQMATVRFLLVGVRPELLDAVVVEIAPVLEVPWPCLLRVDAFDLPPLSRLLTAESRVSGAVTLGVDGGQSNAGPLVGMALKFQALVPSVSWIAIGFQHIIPTGLDHIIFILGLFFLSTKLSSLLAQVTAFTAAHSLTLAMATLGWISVSPNIVEPLIAASIVYVAVDNLYAERVARWRLLVVLGFGLLHGLGFASALDAMSLPESSMISALLLFNLGVELGQIAVLALAFIAVGWLRHSPLYRIRIVEPANLTIAGIGLYWLIRRLAF